MRILEFSLRQSTCSIGMSENHWCQVLCYTISYTVMNSRYHSIMIFTRHAADYIKMAGTNV